MTDFTPTADLYDLHGERLASCDTQFRQYGGRNRFAGTAVTLRAHEDNGLLKHLLGEPGRGKVAVVDASGSVHCAMLGDKMADLARENGWEGVVINGAIRDVAALSAIDIGIKALGSNPRKSRKDGAGARDVPVEFGGVTFRPGMVVVSDEDGLVALEN